MGMAMSCWLYWPPMNMLRLMTGSEALDESMASDRTNLNSLQSFARIP